MHTVHRLALALDHLLQTASQMVSQISSNLQHTRASNVPVSSCRVFVAVVVFACALWGSAVGDPYANVPTPTAKFVPAQLSGHAPRRIAANPGRTFDLYGPQATERAVRSSLKVALVPDPLAMGALNFCAFALRWIRQRRSENPARAYPAASHADAVARAA